MPELSRFFGIIIRMYAEPFAPHHRAHFHAYYQEFAAVFALDTLELIAGEMPQKQRRLVEAWAELHREDYTLNWRSMLASNASRSSGAIVTAAIFIWCATTSGSFGWRRGVRSLASSIQSNLVTGAGRVYRTDGGGPPCHSTATSRFR